ncbi:hypothetical protein DFH07DRAFT_937789 [Mycena maculata]|uniref:Uncharacterized protein n=1 Tax=Mycena maculata TaxID=230809 RepID=A0AAD7JUK1_9AGAR|nr:hypothetical protein DFH07DRAFT_937789 [Mycena maculata]
MLLDTSISKCMRGPGKLHQRIVRKSGFLRAKIRDFLVRKVGQTTDVIHAAGYVNFQVYARPREAPPKDCPEKWLFEGENSRFPCPKSGFFRPKSADPVLQSGFLRPDFEKPDEKRPIQGAQGPNLTDHTIGKGQGTTKCQRIVYCAAENGVNAWLFETEIRDFCGQSFGGASRGFVN